MARARKRWARWAHGRVYLAANGNRSYVLRERRGGRRYQFTVSHTEAGAHKQYEIFDRDPERYAPPRTVAAEAFELGDDLAEAYLEHCLRPEAEGGKGNGREWALSKARQLDWWKEELRGRNLRRLELADLRRCLEPDGVRVASYAHKIEVVKDFYAWLREKRDFPHALDPTLSLPVPQARPGSRRKRHKAFSREQHEALLARMNPPYRAIIVVLAGTGWHVSEVGRFARDGRIEPLPPHAADASAAAVLVCPMHKSGEEHRTAVTEPVREAAQELLAHGGFSKPGLYQAVRAACAAPPAIDPPLNPGQYRHAIASWAIEAGAHPAAVAAFLGHRSPATTKRFYALHAVPPRVPTLS